MMLEESVNDAKNEQNNSDPSSTKAATSEAGIIRGVTRSVGRMSAQKGIAMVRLPAVGRLPVSGTKPPVPSLLRAPITTSHKVATGTSALLSKKIPVKQVAKVSDHVSQGISWLDSAAEVSDSTKTQETKSNIQNERIRQLKIFASSLIKNTILGVAVFEIYESFVERIAPKLIKQPQVPIIDDPRSQWPETSFLKQRLHVPVSIHIFGGLLGGCAHGTIATIWDGIATSSGQGLHNSILTMNRIRIESVVKPSLQAINISLPGMVLHHGFSHAVLFGSYEGLKRVFISIWHDYALSSTLEDRRKQFTINDQMDQIVQWEHLSCIFLAGGFAGQAQHIASYFSERHLLNPTIKAPWRKPLLRNLFLPLTGSFLASSIGFIAFEYSRTTNG